MTSQPAQHIITILILRNISQSKGNQAMKFVQVIKDNKRYIYEAEKLVSDFFLFFKKALYELKASGLKLNFNIFR